jgi:hypothetical protein
MVGVVQDLFQWSINPLAVVGYMILLWMLYLIAPNFAVAFSIINGRRKGEEGSIRECDVKSRTSISKTTKNCHRNISLSEKNSLSEKKSLPEKKSLIAKTIWILAVLGVWFFIEVLSQKYDMGKLLPMYFILIDVPLSVIIPALYLCGRRKIMKLAAVLLVGGPLVLLSSCNYKSIEEVSYLNAVIIRESAGDSVYGEYISEKIGVDAENKATKEKSTNIYSLIVSVPGGGMGDEEVMVFNAEGESFEAVRESFDRTNAKTLDVSHTEYIVLENERVFDSVRESLLLSFGDKGVKVVFEDELSEEIGIDELVEYLKNHGVGANLATLER